MAVGQTRQYCEVHWDVCRPFGDIPTPGPPLITRCYVPTTHVTSRDDPAVAAGVTGEDDVLELGTKSRWDYTKFDMYPPLPKPGARLHGRSSPAMHSLDAQRGAACSAYGQHRQLCARWQFGMLHDHMAYFRVNCLAVSLYFSRLFL